MKTRIIQTRFWDDEFISDADLYTQHLYMYLLTCPHINMSGLFQLPIKKIQFEAKLTDKQITEAISKLQEANKVHFYQGWVYVVNAMKNNNYVRSSDNVSAFNREIERVPTVVLQYFNSTANTTVTVLSTVVPTVPRKENKEIRIENTEYRKEKKEQKKENITNQDELRDYMHTKFKGDQSHE